jgi:prepilin-type processing-associated H-X9-DG protein
MIARLVSLLVAIVSFVVASAASAEEPLIDVRFAGLHATTPHAKDRGLHAAMVGLGARLADLEGELELEPAQAEAIALAWDVLSGGLAVRLDALDERGPRMLFVSRPGGREAAPGVYRRIARLMEESGLPVDRLAADALTLDSPAGTVTLTTDRLAVTARLGQPDPFEWSIDQFDLPEGVQPLASGRIDIGELMEAFGPMIASGLEEGLQDLPPGTGLERWLSPDAPVLTFAGGVGGGRIHNTSRLIDAREILVASGARPEVVFNKDDFGAVPADAVRVYAVPLATQMYLTILDAMAEERGEDVFGELERELGFNLRDDLLGNLGERAVLYQAESTGGGGLFSTVAVIDLADAEAFAAAHTDAVASINRLAADEARGYVRIRNWDAGGAAAFSMTTPGLPVPLEISWAVSGNRLVAAVSPQGLRAGLAQLREDRSSVADNPLFARAVLERMPAGGASQVVFTDSARLARRGYGATAALLVGLANAVRSPADPERVAGPLMPPFAEFVGGIEPSASIAWWDGDDYRVHAVADASVAVAAAAAIGSVADLQALLAPALGAGVLLPAIGKARETATQLKSATQVRSVVQGALVYASNNDDRPPASLEVLLEEGILTEEVLVSPYGPAPDGGPSIAYRATDWLSFDAREILVIDRAMMFEGRGVANVGFADGHVETLSYAELAPHLELRQNQGVREALGIIEY